MNKIGIISFILTIFISLFSGCAGYRLGPTNGLAQGERSISVKNFINKSVEPGIVDELMTSLRREIQIDGTYRLDTKGRGNLIISGTILELQREAISLNPNRIEASRDLRLTLLCELVVSQRNSGDVILRKLVSARSAVRNQGDLNRVDQQTVPQMTEQLSRKILSIVADGDWESQLSQ